MRFNDRLTFVVVDGESHYDPKIGNWVEGTPIRDTVPCNITTLRIDRKQELFGKIDTNVRVARLQQPYSKDFNYIELGGKRQNIIQRSDYKKGVFYLESDRHGN